MNFFESVFQEASELSQEEKMEMWHNGTRGFNISAASTSKLRTNLKICRAKKFTAEASQIETELRKRGLKVDLEK